ncbi:hypothetical protein YQE_08061, partial [Dendroctonus ponderosae]
MLGLEFSRLQYKELKKNQDNQEEENADYFLNGSSGQYMYLETIQEETSDDLRSDSDVDSRNSPVGWLATDSEDGSVICNDQLDDVECESDREIACPPKRRKQENFLSLSEAEDDEELSLSRSSSLLQFETLEKECQENQSPRIFSQFSFDPLDIAKTDVQDFSPGFEVDIFQTFGNELNRRFNVSSLTAPSKAPVGTRFSITCPPDTPAQIPATPTQPWKIPGKETHFPKLGGNGGTKKFSSENLSEDSGYGEQLLSSLNNHAKLTNPFMVSLSSSTGNLMGLRKSDSNKMAKTIDDNPPKRKKNSYVGFGAYDCDVFQLTSPGKRRKRAMACSLKHHFNLSLENGPPRFEIAEERTELWIKQVPISFHKLQQMKCLKASIISME